MAEFSQTIEAQLSGATVRASAMVRFDFLSATVRLWPGFGDLVTGGETWQGIGNLGMISGVSTGPGLAVEEMTFQLFGDQALLANFSESADEAAGREVEVFLQFFDIRQFDESGDWVEWQPLDDPMQIFWGTMGPLKVERPEAGNDAASARAQRILSVTASNALLNRSRPPFGFYSDRDQKARHPGDEMFSETFRMADLRVRWPRF